MGYRIHSLQCSAMMSFQRSDGLGRISKKGVKWKRLRSDVTHARCSHVTYALKKLIWFQSYIHQTVCLIFSLKCGYVFFLVKKINSNNTKVIYTS